MGRYKYKINEKCKNNDCNFSARVKGYCSHCYANNKHKEKKNNNKKEHN
jgi:hypothetical protein